ncbi:hypothetical protein Tco_0265943 [Tanacetum coccineum]
MICPQIDHEDLEQLDEFDLEEMDLKWQSVEQGKSDNWRRVALELGNKAWRRLVRRKDYNALVTIDGEGVDWTSNSEEEEDYALMACNSSGSDTELPHQQGQLWYEEKIRFMKIDLDDKTDVLTYHKKLLAEVKMETRRFKAKYDGILSYENKVLQSVFMSKESELENQPLYDRFVTAGGMHAVPPPMTGNYMPSGPDVEIDYSQFTYGPKQSQTSESETQTNDFDTCESDCSVETHESLPEPTVNEPKINAARPSGTNNVSTARHNFNRHAVPTNAAMKVNTVKPIVNRLDHCVLGKRETAIKPSTGCNWRQQRHHWHKVSKYNGGSRLSTLVFTEPKELLTSDVPAMTWKTRLPLLNSRLLMVLVAFGGSKGKFDGKSDEGFLVGYSLQSKAFRKRDLTGVYDLDYLTDSMNYQPVRSENQANKHAGPQEANHNAGTKDNIDAGDSEKEDESAQDYFVLPIWSSYSSTVKRSTAKDAGEAPNKHPDLKTDEKPVDKEDQVFLDELERLKRQEQDANNAAEALRKEFAQETEDLLLQAGAAKTSSTNIVNTVSTPVSTASPYGGLSFTDLTNPDQDDSEIPALEEIYDNPTDGIFTNSSYDDEGAVADFTNLEPVVNVSPIPTSRINSIHPSTLILGDPQSAVQTRSKVTKSSGAHAFVSYIQKQNEKYHRNFQALFIACFLICLMGRRLLEQNGFIEIRSEEECGYGIKQGNPQQEVPSLGCSIADQSKVRTLISLSPTITNSTTMDVLESCPKHNMVAYLEKTEGNAEFHEIIDFLARSSIHNALTVSPVVSTTFVEQFWMSAKSKIINNVRVLVGNHGGQSSSDKSLSGNEGDMTLQSVYDLFGEVVFLEATIDRKKSLKKHWMQKESIPTGEEICQSEPSVHKDPLFDELPEDTLDYMDTEDAQDVGRTRDVDKCSTDKTQVNTDKEKIVPISSDEAKVVSREKEKRVELKDVEETERPRPTSTRSLLTLSLLPRLIKMIREKEIEEEDESELNLRYS